MSWSGWLDSQSRERHERGLTRELHPRDPAEPALDLAGNDYLGLSRHPDVVEAAVAAAQEWGAGAGASRLVTGTLQLHADLEDELGRLMRQPRALVTSTGYHANLAAVCALADREAVVVSDAHVHASLVDAARLSRAEVVVTPHGDVAAVDAALRRTTRRALVLAESVYSVLGDAAPLAELAEVCARRGALLLVDEAHGLGVAGAEGRGLLAALDLAGRSHVVATATLSKALGTQGGAVLGAGPVIDQVVNRGRAFIYDTGLAPASAGAALAAVRHLRDHPDLPRLVARRVARLAEALGQAVPAGAVLSVPMDSAQAAVAGQAAAQARGVRVGCFRPPSTPDGVSRLRITASAALTDEEWTAATEVLVDVVRRPA